MAAGGDATGGPLDPEYLVEHLRSALATDPRVLQQGLDVVVTGDLVVVRGSVSTGAVRDGVAAVAHEVAPALQVVNDVEVTPTPEPDVGDVEDLV
jgi:osmotically-inducible protein OsmY